MIPSSVLQGVELMAVNTNVFELRMRVLTHMVFLQHILWISAGLDVEVLMINMCNWGNASL